MLALLLHGDPTRRRGSPGDPELAREADIRVDGDWLAGVSTATLMEDRHPHTRGAQRDQSWVAGRKQGLV